MNTSSRPGIEPDTEPPGEIADPWAASWITSSSVGSPATPAVRTEQVAVEQHGTAGAGPERAEAERSGRGGTWGAVLVAVLVALGFGGFDLSNRQIWQDETATWWAATLSWSDFVRLMQHIDIVLAPFYVLMHFWADLFGTSAAALRMPSVIATAATAGLLVLLGRRLFGTPQGLVAAIIYAAIPATTRYAQEARPYALAVLTAVAATLLLLRALERPSGPRWIAYGAMIPLMGMAHLVTLTVLGAHAAMVIGHGRRERRSTAQWWLGVFYGLLLVGPIIAMGHSQSAQVSWITTSWSALPDFPDQLFLSHTAALAVVAAAVLGLLLQRKWKGALLTWALLPPVVLFATRNSLDLFLPRYMLFTLPAWALLASAGLCSLVGLVVRRRATARAVGQILLGVGAATALVLTTLPAFAAVHASPQAGQPDFQSAAQFLQSNEKPGDGIAFGGYNSQPQRLTAYFLRNGLVPRAVFQSQTPQQVGAYAGTPCADPAACAQSVDRIWLVTTTPTDSFYEQLPQLQAQLLKTAFTVSTKGHFAGSLRVYLFVRNGSAAAKG